MKKSLQKIADGLLSYYQDDVTFDSYEMIKRHVQSLNLNSMDYEDIIKYICEKSLI